jgi:hypothetical protein
VCREVAWSELAVAERSGKSGRSKVHDHNYFHRYFIGVFLYQGKFAGIKRLTANNYYINQERNWKYAN